MSSFEYILFTLFVFKHIILPAEAEYSYIFYRFYSENIIVRIVSLDSVWRFRFNDLNHVEVILELDSRQYSLLKNSPEKAHTLID